MALASGRSEAPRRAAAALNIAALLVAAYVANVVSNLASLWSAPRAFLDATTGALHANILLPDLGLRAVPHIACLWLTDLFVALPAAYTALYIATLDAAPAASIGRITNSLAILYLLRWYASCSLPPHIPTHHMF